MTWAGLHYSAGNQVLAAGEQERETRRAIDVENAILKVDKGRYISFYLGQFACGSKFKDPETFLLGLVNTWRAPMSSS